MADLDAGIQRLLARLQDAGFEFAVIGGVAAIAHGASTLTRDLDLAAPMTAENLARLLDALRPLHPRHVLRPDLGELVDLPERGTLSRPKDRTVEAELRAIRDVLRGSR